MNPAELLKNKTVLYGAGGAVILFLLYRYYKSRQSGGQTQPTPIAPDQSGVTAAEQAASQESADVAQLQADLAGLQSNQDALASTLQGMLDQAQAAVASALPEVLPPGTVAGLATGKHRPRRSTKPKPTVTHNKTIRAPQAEHPHAHQSNQKQAGSGAIAPRHHTPHERAGVAQAAPAARSAPATQRQPIRAPRQRRRR